jgi:hypothetical protein
MEIMNLDEMAEKQEAEEKEEEEVIEEVIVHEYDDSFGEVIYHDHDGVDHATTYSLPPLQRISHDDLTHLVAVTEHMEGDTPSSAIYDNASSSFLPAHHSPLLKSSTQPTTAASSIVKKVIKKKVKKPKKKKKVLDFFGTGDYADDDDAEEKQLRRDVDAHSGPAVNGFDNDVGFALGSLFDIEMPPEDHRIEDGSSSSAAHEGDDITAYLSTFFATGEATGVDPTGANSVVGSVLSMTLPTSLSFFDAIDEEIDLADDPILQQVERNRTLGTSQTPSKPSYVSYLESILPPPSRLFGYDDTEGTSEDAEQRRLQQQQQQQVDRILGLTNTRSRGLSGLAANRGVMGTCRSCLIQTRNVVLVEWLSIMVAHVLLAVKNLREIVGFLMEQLIKVVTHLKGCILLPEASSTRGKHVYQLGISLSLVTLGVLKMGWTLVYLVLRLVISVVWHAIQIGFLTGVYLLQCVRGATSTTGSSTTPAAEEQLQQWRTRWRNFAEEYLSSNNVLSKL